MQTVPGWTTIKINKSRLRCLKMDVFMARQCRAHLKMGHTDTHRNTTAPPSGWAKSSLTWKRTSWLTLCTGSSNAGLFLADRERWRRNSSLRGRPSCWERRACSWERSMEPSRIMESGGRGLGMKARENGERRGQGSLREKRVTEEGGFQDALKTPDTSPS